MVFFKQSEKEIKGGVKVYESDRGRKQVRQKLPQLAQSAGSRLRIWVSTLHHQHFSKPASTNGDGVNLLNELHYYVSASLLMMSAVQSTYKQDADTNPNILYLLHVHKIFVV